MLEPEFVRERRVSAKRTLANLKKKKQLIITMSKGALMGYCKQTIIYCDVLLELMKERDENS